MELLENLDNKGRGIEEEDVKLEIYVRYSCDGYQLRREEEFKERINFLVRI